jgi:ABC-2 type transport system permease protein
VTTSLTGTWRLVRLALRRDRILLPAWSLSITGLAAAVVASVVGLYSTAEERAAAAAFGAGNPLVRVFDGPASGTDPGAMAWVEAAWLLAVLTALMCAQAVVRHTRLDEEAGRAELIGAAVVGHHARLAAALAVAGIAGALAGAGVAFALIANGLDAGGSLLAGAGIATVGWVFAGVAAVAAQLSATARGANGMAGAVLGAAFLLRAAGDAGGRVGDDGMTVVSAWPSWLSPIGWVQQLRPFAEDHVALLAAPLALFVLLTVAAVMLESHRDVGSGIVQPRPGPARARPTLLRPLGLAWRLQRGSLLAFALGIGVLGAAFGAVGESAGDLADLSEDFAAALEALAPGASLVDLYIAFAVGWIAIAVSAFAVQSLLRLRNEELSGRAEGLLATAVPRWRWVGSHLVIAGGGTVLLLALLGVAGMLSYGAITGAWPQGAGFLWASLAHVPAALVVAAFVLAAVTFMPRWAAALGWGALAVSLVLGQLGAQFELPQAVLNLSPFTHVPPVPAGTIAVLPLVVLSAVAVALVGVAALRFQQRDLALAV